MPDVDGRRLFWATFIAPLAAPAGYVLGAVAIELGDMSNHRGLSSLFNLALPVFIVGAPVAYGATLVGGLPAYLLLRHGGWQGRRALWAAGAAIGAAVAVIMAPGLRGGLFSVPF